MSRAIHRCKSEVPDFYNLKRTKPEKARSQTAFKRSLAYTQTAEAQKIWYGKKLTVDNKNVDNLSDELKSLFYRKYLQNGWFCGILSMEPLETDKPKGRLIKNGTRKNS